MNSSNFVLIRGKDKCVLVSKKHPEFKPFSIDFTSGNYFNIYKKGLSKKDPLSRALGNKTECIKVLDLTAGWLKDSWMMLVLGCNVTACEKNKLVYELVQSALKQANNYEPFKEMLSRLTFLLDDSLEFIEKNNLSDWDVIYLDPMFPGRNKTALSGKEMQILQDLISDEDHGNELLAKVLQKKVKRVIVKRPRHSKDLVKGVTFCTQGKASRFDVYVNAD
ncbi:MAG: class I SAM-dependent methyltransferase [Bdellovibrionaceae bacterium]|nr:class I SAM-dependent methyltransferase [Pseudobdellovibrionaceae bacterium]